MDAIRHFSHEHLLAYHDILIEDAHLHACALCWDLCGSGDIFRCESCEFRLHKRCALQPQEITHSHHYSDHQLNLVTQEHWEKHSLCKQCLTPLFGFYYSCFQCDFNLHLGCVRLTSLSADGVPKLKRGCTHGVYAPISFQLSKITEIFGQKLIIDGGVCRWCQKGIFVVAGTVFYACLVRKINPYGACTLYVPVTILHFFHKQHPLHIRIVSIKSGQYCFPCGVTRSDCITFVCGDCRDLELHGLQYSSGLLLFKSKYHVEHNLTYFRKDDHGKILSPCAKCRVPINRISDDYKGFYCCQKCKINFHFSCVIQHFEKRKGHLPHRLALLNHSTDALSRCSICEEEIDRNHDLYECREYAHIECAIFYENMEHPRHPQNSILSVEDAVKMGPGGESLTQLSFHKHPLLYEKNFVSGYDCRRCKLCFMNVNHRDDHFYCMTCKNQRRKFVVHRRCAQQPDEFVHPGHPNHRLKLVSLKSFSYNNGPSMSKVECNACWLPLFEFNYRCFHCDDFNLHFICARFADCSRQRMLKKKVSIKLTSHHHDLTLMDADIVGQTFGKIDIGQENTCSWCIQMILSREFYVCFSCELVLHTACATEVVALGDISIRHPSHELHPLHIQFHSTEASCFVCGESLKRMIGFFCKDCYWIGLHGRCTTLLPNFKSDEYHGEHSLTYFQKAGYPIVRSRSMCGKCSGDIDSASDPYKGFYGCVECKINFHLSCILPQTIKHKYHSWHSLVLQNSSRDDDDDFSSSQEYYCDICETPRDPDHSFYNCEECNSFNAHIECVLKQERNQDLCGYAAAIQALRVSNARKALGNHCQELTAGQIQHPSHGHVLSLVDKPKKDILSRCKACSLIVSGQAYTCTTCQDYCLHKVCANLSRHPPKSLHSLPQHPHSLALYFGYMNGKWFRCDVCGDINKKDSFNYRCLDCEFTIDFKCVAFNHKDASQARRMNKLESFLSFPFHRHQLHLGNYKNEERLHCRACVHQIAGLTYCCLFCDFFLHISCIGRFSQKLELPFYSSPFELGIYKMEESPSCLACRLPLIDSYLYYTCRDYLPEPLCLHPGCSDTLLKRILAYRAHEHVLYFFGRDNQIMFKGLRLELRHELKQSIRFKKLKQSIRFKRLRQILKQSIWFECAKCYNNCIGDFYRCIKCERNFHLKCVPIPKAVKSKWHVHQLKLKDSFDDEDYDHDDQHCEVCEEERKPEDHVYVCEECSIPFASHIACVLHHQHQHQQIEEGYNVEGNDEEASDGEGRDEEESEGEASDEEESDRA